jgi:hypothetical protein
LALGIPTAVDWWFVYFADGELQWMVIWGVLGA